MSIVQPLPVNTAPPIHSIWRDVSQSTFRTRIDQLQRKTDVPGESKTHTYEAWRRQTGVPHESPHLLPSDVEERVVNDIAFIAANRKDVNSVSAVALEEQRSAHGLIVRLAANGAIEVLVINTLSSIFGLLQDCALKRLSRDKCEDGVFNHVIHLNRDRMHGRLQSKHYKPPDHHDQKDRRPLSQELQGLSRHVTSAKNSAELKEKLTALSSSYRRVDDCTRGTAEEESILRSVAQQSFDFCTPEGRTIERTITSYGFNDLKILEDKHIRQVNKLGRYWGLCRDLADASRKYGRVFETIKLRPLVRYDVFNAPIPNKPGRMPCHVHAEIQLLIFYCLHPDSITPRPRILGVSKAACYLCDLFILNHRHFFVTKTHGRLYALWNVPDLAEYNQAQLSEIRRVLVAMDKEIEKAVAKNHTARRWPTESYVHLPPLFLTSPVTSDLGTLPSTASDRSVAAPLATYDEQPPANSIDHVVGSSIKITPCEAKHKPVQSTQSVPTSIPDDVIAADGRPPDIETQSTQLTGSAQATPNRTRSRSPRSSSSAASSEDSLQWNISASAPAQAQVDNIFFIFEVDGYWEGTCRMAKTLRTEDRFFDSAVDLQAMEPNEERRFSKDAPDDRLVLNLRSSPLHSLRLSFEWK